MAWPVESWMKASLTARIASGMVKASRIFSSVMYLNLVCPVILVTSAIILPEPEDPGNGNFFVDLGSSHLLS
jgi:hypothetical protein